MLQELRAANRALAAAGIGKLFDADAFDDDARTALFDSLAEAAIPIRERYAWACPDSRALRALASCGPLVEVGAGHGYWASLLRARGADVLAFDLIGTGADGSASGGKAAGGAAEAKKRKGAARHVDAKRVRAASSGGCGNGGVGGSGGRGGSREGAAEAAKAAAEALGVCVGDGAFWTHVGRGGAEVLATKACRGRALFLCFPDEVRGCPAGG